MKKIISVIVPVYNDQAGLLECLNYLYAQEGLTLYQVEIIVVDNASSPPMEISAAPPIETKLCTCEIKGSYAARNSGVVNSRGSIFAFTDADCRPEPNWLATGIEAVSERGDTCIIGGEVNLQLSARPTYVEKYQHLQGFDQRNTIKYRRFSATANVFIPRSVLMAAGPFDETMLSCGDAEWCWRAQNLGYQLDYSEKSIVHTTARRSLRSAITQARRVAGGRHLLKHTRPPDIPGSGLVASHERGSVLEKVQRVICNPKIPNKDKFPIFAIALIVRIFFDIERLRMILGFQAERR